MQLSEGMLFSRDRYKLIKLLGRGGFSEVWLVQDMRTGLEQALKVYAPGMGLDEDGIALFIKEFSLVYNFNHSNLLKPSYFDEVDNMPFLIMPYIQNGSTNKMIGKMDEDTAWRFFHDVASGLAYLHTHNPPIIHQDIKPDNIMIGENETFLITDFGISMQARHTLQRSVRSSTTLDFGGTIPYMGPERFGKMPAPVKSSDVWALGATVFELMEGYAPFGPNGGLIQKSGADLPDMISECSDELRTLVELCLHIETWNRPTADKIVELCVERRSGRPLIFPEHQASATPTGKPIVTPSPKSKTPSEKPVPVVSEESIIAEVIGNEPSIQEDDNIIAVETEEKEPVEVAVSVEEPKAPPEEVYIEVEKPKRRSKAVAQTIIASEPPVKTPPDLEPEQPEQPQQPEQPELPEQPQQPEQPKLPKLPSKKDYYESRSEQNEEALQEPPISVIENRPKLSKTFLYAIAGVVAALILGGGIYFIFNNSGKTDEKTEQPAEPKDVQTQVNELIEKGDRLFAEQTIRNLKDANDAYSQAKELTLMNGLETSQHLNDQIKLLSQQIDDSVKFYLENADFFISLIDNPDVSAKDKREYSLEASNLLEKYLILRDDEHRKQQIEKLKINLEK